MEEMNRRTFIKGAAFGAAGLAATGVFIGCSPQSGSSDASEASGVSDSDASSSSSIPADASSKKPIATEPALVIEGESTFPTNDPYMYEPCAAGEGEIAFVVEPISDDEIVATYDVDVVVCGLGPAGDAAALSCAEHDLKIVAVEKNSGANYCSATLGGTDSKIFKHWSVEFDKKAWLQDALIDCGYRGDGEIYQRWLERNGEAVDWYIGHFDNQDEDHYPLTFAAGDFPDFNEPYADTCFSRSWNTSFNLPYTPAELAKMLPQMIQDAGDEVRFECPACQLIADDSGAVIGVIVKSSDGYEKYNCAKGVVLATGGYEYNPEKLKRSCRPRDLALCGWITPTVGNTGDGHEMALAIGAVEDEYPHPLMLDPMNLMPFLRVNKCGKRFVGEYEPYNHLACAIQAQPGAYCFYIVDDALPTKIDSIWTACSSAWGPKEDWVNSAMDSETALPWRSGSRTLYQADTLEDLADQMGIDPDAFVETINRWNDMCDTGEDTDFYFPSEMMYKIDTPPYYTTLEGAESLSTAGGLQIDRHSRVLNADFQPIQGLFAVGLTSGSMFQNTYPHTLNCLSHTRNCTFGYMIGTYLSGDES